MRLSCGEREEEVRIEEGRAMVGDATLELSVERDARGLSAVVADGLRVGVRTLARGDRVLVWCAGRVYDFARAGRVRARDDHAGEITAPMPGKIRRVAVKDGAPVTKGEVVLVLEAMKMEHAIRAPHDGMVRFARGEGDLVEAGERLAEIERVGSAP